MKGLRSAITTTCVTLSIVWACVVCPAIARDYSFLELYQLAHENDALFHAEKNELAAFELNPKIARGALFPQLDLSGSYTRFANQESEGQIFGGEGEFTSDSNSWNLALTQTLFDKEKFVRLRQSKSEAEKAAFELQVAHQDLILRLATTYFDILTAESHLTFAQAEKEAVGRQLQQAQRRFEVGLTPITDAKEAQAAYDLAVADEIDAQNDLENSYHRLEIITNLSIRELMPLREEISIIPPQPDNIEDWVEQAVSHNADVLAQQIAANIAQQEIDIQKADHYPSLDMFVEGNKSDIRGGSAPRETEDVRIGVSVNVPLFAGGTTYYKAQQAEHRYRRSREMLIEMQRQVRKQAQEAYRNVIASISRIAALRRAIESAQAAVDSNQAGFDVGTRTSAEVLLVLKDLFKAQRDYAEARHNYVLNVLRLKQASGSLGEADVQQINQQLKTVSY